MNVLRILQSLQFYHVWFIKKIQHHYKLIPLLKEKKKESKISVKRKQKKCKPWGKNTHKKQRALWIFQECFKLLAVAALALGIDGRISTDAR